MITSKAFKDWLKGQFPQAMGYYSGSLGDANLERTLTVYPYKGVTQAMQRVDGKSGYHNQAFTVLIRWTRSSEESEMKAYEVYRIIEDYPEAVTMHSGSPMFLGVDDDVHEYVINFNVLHKEE
ncbi:hypothetical protein DSECCO2_551660 [anaerobic digester metagenome]